MSENVLITSMRQQLNEKLSSIISEFRKKIKMIMRFYKIANLKKI